VVVELLYVAECPHYRATLGTIERLLEDRAGGAELRVVEIRELESAERLRFLGSPTVRVDGEDVEPGAKERTEYTIACRVYRTDEGVAGEPDERWIRAALDRAPKA
jgi:hypothetical protein